MKLTGKCCSIILIFFMLAFITGCCSSGGGGSKSSTIALKDVTINPDGSVFYDSGEGLRFTALPGTFSESTKIRFSKITGGDKLGHLGLSGKPVTVVGDVFQMEIEPEIKLLSQPATITLSITDNYDDSKKMYFALQRDFGYLVTNEIQSNSLSQRQSTSKEKSLSLPFIGTFKTIGLANINKETIKKDVKLYADNPVRDVSKESKYESDVTLTSDFALSTPIKEYLDNVNKHFSLYLKSDGKDFSKLTEATISDKKSEKNYLSGYINFKEHGITNIVDDSEIEYFTKLSSKNLKNTDLPRRLITEAIFTDDNQIPVSSQENVIFFNNPRRPYVVMSVPANKEVITSYIQMENLVIVFSMPMNTKSVEEAFSMSAPNITVDYKSFEKTWSENNKKLTIKLPNDLRRPAEYTVKIAKTAKSATGIEIATKSFSEIPEDYILTFTSKIGKSSNLDDFFVYMETPALGSINVPINQSSTPNKGPEIVLKFNRNFEDKNVNPSTIKLYKDNEEIKYTSYFVDSRKDNTYTFYTSTPLESGTYYTVTVSKDIKSLPDVTLGTKEKALGYDYEASFITVNAFEGSGTSEDPFQITNQSQINTIRDPNYINKGYYFKLMNNISFVQSKIEYYWQPIGNFDNAFIGNFDGNGKTLSNFKMSNPHKNNTGIFGYSSSSSFKNLTIENSESLGDDYVAILTGGAYNSQFDNIVIKDPTIKGDNYCGAIIGHAKNCSITNSKFLDTHDSSFMGTSHNVGGIAGYASYDSLILSCEVNVNLLSGSEFVGGIVGQSVSSDINTCKFIGNIKGQEEDIGGICGKSEKSTITKCLTSKGNIEGLENVGGIVGLLDDSSIVDYCQSESDITSPGTAGGIAGMANKSSIYNSYTGEVTIYGNSLNVGGIAGIMNSSGLDNCYSKSSVKGSNNVGGICGSADALSAINNSFSANKALFYSDTLEPKCNLILGSGPNNVIVNCYNIKGYTKFNPANPDTKHEYNPLDGTEKDKASFNQNFYEGILKFSAKIWDTTKEFPILK